MKSKRYILRVYNKKDPSQFVDSHTNNPKRRRRQILDDILVNKGYLESPSRGCFSRFDIFFELETTDLGYTVFRVIGDGDLCKPGAFLSDQAQIDETELEGNFNV